MYNIKNYELYNGDCLEIMKTLEDQSIDLILCDPPFGTTDCKWDSIIPFEDLWKQFYKSVNIEERKNPKCQKRMMPTRYWKHLTEMN